MKRSKRYNQLASKIDKDKLYGLDEAIKLIKDTGVTKFDSSVEVHAKLGIDPKKTDQQVRATTTLPHGTGKVKKIAAFVSEDRQKDAKSAGADIVGGEELIEEIKKTGKLEFDIAITTPNMMPKLASIAKILGPRGMMPSPKNDTITTDLKKTIDELKKGKVNFKNDDTSNVHQVIGKVSFSEAQLKENFETFIDSLKKAKPASAKGIYIRSITLASTMSSGIKIQTS